MNQYWAKPGSQIAATGYNDPESEKEAKDWLKQFMKERGLTWDDVIFKQAGDVCWLQSKRYLS